VKIALAEMSLDSGGDWKEATASLREAVPQLHSAIFVDDELLAKALLAEALLAQGDRAGAEGAIQSARYCESQTSNTVASFMMWMYDSASRMTASSA
jgi:hypothetical protein